MSTFTEEPPAYLSSPDLRATYGLARLSFYAIAATALAVIIAGFWNFHLVDGFGRDVVAGTMIGNTSDLAGGYAGRGVGFGFLFAAVAGLAATFTACNCVVFAMIPGLACAPDGSGRAANPWKALGAFVTGVLIVCAAYGAYIGLLGPERIEAFNARSVRLAQAQATFTLIGLVMLGWGISELGFLDAWKASLSSSVRAFFHAVTTKAALIGILVGLFAVGRPFPVFREFLTYAASAESPLYGSAVMMVQGLGQIIVMMILFALMVLLGGRRLMNWATDRPHQPRLISGLALLAGGAFFVFYWGLAFAFDVGRWGFKLGWYA